MPLEQPRTSGGKAQNSLRVEGERERLATEKRINGREAGSIKANGINGGVLSHSPVDCYLQRYWQGAIYG